MKIKIKDLRQPNTRWRYYSHIPWPLFLVTKIPSSRLELGTIVSYRLKVSKEAAIERDIELREADILSVRFLGVRHCNRCRGRWNSSIYSNYECSVSFHRELSWHTLTEPNFGYNPDFDKLRQLSINTSSSALRLRMGSVFTDSTYRVVGSKKKT